MLARESMQLIRANANAFPGRISARSLRKTVDLQARESAWFQDAHRLAQIGEHHFRARDVLEHRIGVNEIEVVRREVSEVAATGMMDMRPRYVAQFHACL